MAGPGRGGIVLAGGASTRMGRDKASLPWGEGTLLSCVIGVLAVAFLVGCGPSAAPLTGTIRMATTTSLRDTGLLEVLLPAFRQEMGIEVTPYAFDTEGALACGRRGDADVLLVPAGEAASQFVDAGLGASVSEAFELRPTPQPGSSHRYLAILVRPVAGPGQRAEPARRFYEWLLGPRCRSLLATAEVGGRRAFIAPAEGARSPELPPSPRGR